MGAAARRCARGSRCAGAGPFWSGDLLTEWELPAARSVFSALPRLAAALALAAATLAPPAALAVTIGWVTVGAAGNAADTSPVHCGPSSASPCGAVATPYRIGKYEVTNAQYAEFLNSVAATDTNALYHPSMGSNATFGGITRSGVSGSYSYAVKSGFASKPVRLVLGRGALLQLAAERPADGPADVVYDRGRRLHAHARGDRGQLGAAQRDYKRLRAERERVVQGGLLRPDRGAVRRLPDGDECGHGLRGGGWAGGASNLATGVGSPTREDSYVGLRVARIPEPSTALLVLAGLGSLALRRRRRG